MKRISKDNIISNIIIWDVNVSVERSKILKNQKTNVFVTRTKWNGNILFLKYFYAIEWNSFFIKFKLTE